MGFKMTKKLDDLVFYHGTSSVFEEEIDKHGLLPSIDTGNCTTGSHSETPNGYDETCNYLGSGADAIHFAWIATEKHGGEPILYEIRLNKENLENLLPDTDSREYNWEDSYDASGKVAYCGEIPLNQIKKLEEGTDW